MEDNKKVINENITEDEIVALEKIVDLQEFYLMKNDYEQILRLDGDFHKIIYSYQNL